MQEALPCYPSQAQYVECFLSPIITADNKETFAVPANMKLHAVPVYEFYDNASRYGPQFAGLPYLLSK
jgi:cleavage and polyadenylation specificity factor subunit 5